MMREAVEDITKTLNEAASELGMVSGMVDGITQAINKVRFAGGSSLLYKIQTMCVFLSRLC